MTKKDIPVGFIEAKDIGDKDLEGKKKSVNKEQFDRYKASLDNLIFTDYIDFHLYNDGENVMIGTQIVDESAALAVESKQQGILLPRMTLIERDAIVSPTTSLLIFQTDDTPGFYYYNGTEWVNLASSNTNNNTNNGSGGSNSETLIYTVDGF